VGWPTPLQPDEAPPAGLEPAASGLRARRHLPFDHGGLSSGGRDRTCASRLTAARLAARLHRNRRKERESNPQGPEAHPFSRRDTAPVAVLPDDPGRTRTCTSPIKSRPLCRLSYGAGGVVGRSRTCTPRVSSGRSTVRATTTERVLGGAGIELCHARLMPSDVFQATRLPFDPGSTTAVAHVRGGRRPTWRGFGARFPAALQINRTLKPRLLYCALLPAETPRIFLSQAGPRFRSNACSS
jgi:hypothetical protein